MSNYQRYMPCSTNFASKFDQYFTSSVNVRDLWFEDWETPCENPSRNPPVEVMWRAHVVLPVRLAGNAPPSKKRSILKGDQMNPNEISYIYIHIYAYNHKIMYIYIYISSTILLNSLELIFKRGFRIKRNKTGHLHAIQFGWLSCWLGQRFHWKLSLPWHSKPAGS